MTGSLQIRPYAAADRKFLVDLSDLTQRYLHTLDPIHHGPVGPGEAARWVGQALRELRARKLFILIAERGGERAGYVMGCLDDDGWDRRHPRVRRKGGLVIELHVSPPHRRRGVGQALLRAAEDALALRGCTDVTLEYLVGNRAAAALYASRGYAVRNIRAGKRLVRRHDRRPVDSPRLKRGDGRRRGRG